MVPVSVAPDDPFGHWLAGFIDGEGSFAIPCHPNRNKHAPGQPTYGCAFEIKLRDDDAPVLAEIAEWAGFGRLSGRTSRADCKLDEKPQAMWTVRSKIECAALVDLLDRYPLRAKKARDYAVWREAVAEWLRVAPPRRGRPQDWSRMAELKAVLETGRQYGAARIDAFEDEPVSPQLALVV